MAPGGWCHNVRMASEEEVLQRLERIEAGHRDLNGMVDDLRDALIVTAGIQRRQAAVQDFPAEQEMPEREIQNRFTPVGRNTSHAVNGPALPAVPFLPSHASSGLQSPAFLKL